jgi:fumarylpyruvate hydrolase
MSQYLCDPPAVVSAAIQGQDTRFPVRRILCVGQNYQAHKAEMGFDDREPPFFFSKPIDALVQPGADVPYPSVTQNLHFEIELVAAIKTGGTDIPVERALQHVFGYAVGVDMTRRDLQQALRGKGRPWDASKGFDHSGPMSAIKPWSGPAPEGRIWLAVNGDIKQDAVVTDMIWNVAEVVAEASKLWTLAPGDLIFTGTPAGVGPLVRGDAVTCGIDQIGELAFKIV